MKTMTWNEYVELCDNAAAKRKAARKLMRDNHPVFCMIMDIVFDIMVIVSLALLAFSAIQWVAMKVEQIKNIIHEAAPKAKFDGDRDEPVEDGTKFEDYLEYSDEYRAAHADDIVEA